MAIRLDRLTVKAQEAFQAAYGIAADAGQQVIEPEHLLKALIDQADGIVRPILQKVGADPSAIDTEVEEAIAKLPKVAGAGLQVGVGPRMNTVLEQAFKAAEKRKDVYVSTEHMLAGMAEDSGDAGKALARAGVTAARVDAALDELRGGTRVTDENPESQFQSLERFSRNLTQAARDGKLDVRSGCSRVAMAGTPPRPAPAPSPNRS